MQSAGNLIVGFQSGTAAQNLGQPELGDCALHVLDFPLRRRRSLNPLGGLAAHAADHVRMGERLGGSLSRLEVERGWDGLSDAGMQRRGATGDDEGILALIPSHGPVTG